VKKGSGEYVQFAVALYKLSPGYLMKSVLIQTEQNGNAPATTEAFNEWLSKPAVIMAGLRKANISIFKPYLKCG